MIWLQNLPKDPISTDTRNDIYFVACFSIDLGNIGQIKAWLKAKLDEHHLKIKNEEIYSSSISFNC